MAKQPHVLVFPLATRGHVNPMMHFSKLLAAQGILITFVHTEFNSKLIVSSQSDSELQKSGLNIRFVEIPDGLPPEHGRTTDVIEMCQVMMSTMAHPFEKLVDGLMREDPPLTCILADTWMVFSLDVARKFGLPHANFWTQSAISFASILLVVQGYRPPADPQIPGALYLKPNEMNTFVQCYDPSDFMFRFVTGGFDRLSESAWIFINTFDELEQETIDASRLEHPTISTVGPLLPAPFVKGLDDTRNETATLWQEEERCLKWLDKYPPTSVLYVAFGSLAIVSLKQIEELALGLEASGYPFLWVLRSDMMFGKSAVLPEGFIERVKDRAEFVSWAPQLRVLRHKAVGGFFTHGGWNSTLEGITAGVPMLGWPYFSDQPMDCKCIEEGWKIGTQLEVGEGGLLSRIDVEAKVRVLMTSKELRERALQLSSAAQNAALPGGSSFNNFQSFVNALKSI